jgi:hypothetical protein
LTDLQNALVFLLLSLLGTIFFSTWGIKLYMRAMLYNSELTTIALLALIPLLVLLMFGGRRLIHRIRRDFLWRDRGEIVPLKWQVDWRVNLLAAAIWLVLTLIGMVGVSRGSLELDADLRIMIGAAGVATGVVYFSLGRSMGIRRYLWVGTIGGILSLMLIFISVPAGYSWVVFGLIWCGLLIISGLYALRRTLLDLREV